MTPMGWRVFSGGGAKRSDKGMERVSKNRPEEIKTVQLGGVPKNITAALRQPPDWVKTAANTPAMPSGKVLYQNPTAFGLLECSAGVSPAWVSHSMSGETPDLHKSLRKSTNIETSVLLQSSRKAVSRIDEMQTNHKKGWSCHVVQMHSEPRTPDAAEAGIFNR
jgi:hypothetical protein